MGNLTQSMKEFASASKEQAQGIEQLNKAAAEMDKVTQQNAANAEESASASEEFNAQAEQMKEFVSELMSLVGGAANGNGRSGGKHAAEGLKDSAGPKNVTESARRLKAGREKPAIAEKEAHRLIPLEDAGF